jgi:hypothetical protein
MLDLDSKNRAEIDHIRQVLKPRATMRPGPGQSEEDLRAGTYVEIHTIHWSAEGGNVVLVVPMGAEALRVRDEPIRETSTVNDPDSHEVVVSSPHCDDSSCRA